jgi:hypothetical protein
MGLKQMVKILSTILTIVTTMVFRWMDYMNK